MPFQKQDEKISLVKLTTGSGQLACHQEARRFFRCRIDLCSALCLEKKKKSFVFFCNPQQKGVELR